MKDLYRQILDEITPYEPGKPIEEVKRELGLEKVYKLASNESPFGPSPGVLAAIMEAARTVNRYPDGGCFYLKEKLCSILGVNPANLALGNGSDELIILALRAFLRPGEQVLISDPTFMVYRIGARIAEADVVTVPAKDFSYDLDGMLKKITGDTKMIFIANPENPTGTFISSEDMDKFIEQVPQHVVVFIDEAYYEFARGEGYPETIKYIGRKDKNVIISRTFSKAYSLAGLRVGYIIAREDVAEAVNKVREPFNVNSIAQAAALAALDDKQALEFSIEYINAEKKRLCEALNKMDVKYVPSKTNFILIDTERDSKEIFRRMLRQGVIIREMSAWGLKGFVRVNVGLKEENDIFIRAFEATLKKTKKG